MPNNDRVKIFALTLVKNDHNRAVPAQPLHDTLEDHVPSGKPTMTVEGKLDDVCMLSLQNPLYWREGGLHYTLDGTEPTEQSPVYAKPIALYSATTVKAKSFLSSNQASETVDCNVPVSDRTTVAASDAFLPFRDGLDEIAKVGATALIQPGGSVKDEEVIAAADEHGMAMVFTGVRHFRH